MRLNSIRRVKYNLRSNSKTKNKSYYKNQFKIVIIGILIVTIIIVLKRFDTDYSNKTIKLVDKDADMEMNIKDSKKLYGFINGIEDYQNYAVPVFKTENFKVYEDKYATPVSGILYKNYGEIKKSNTKKIFNNGIDILVNDENVYNIKDGTVIEIGKDINYGNFIKVKHVDIISSYYGLDNIYVKNNEYVYSGQVLGNIVEYEEKIKKLHFEIWEDNSPINPLNKIVITTNRY